MGRGYLLVCACAALPLTRGCGLLVVPTVRELPGAVKSVRVVDAQTGDPVADVDVRVRVRHIENWMVQPPRLDAPTPDDDGEDWESLPACDGAFVLKRRAVWGSMRIWLPLPPILGPALLNEPYASIRITAPGRAGVVYTYSPQLPPTPDAPGHKHPDTPAAAGIDRRGVLTIRLPRTAPETRAATR